MAEKFYFAGNSIGKVIYILYAGIFTIIAFGGAMAGVSYQLIKNPGRCFFLGIVLVGILFFSIKYGKEVMVSHEKAWIFWILIGAFLRILYYCMVQTVPMSDFYQPTAFYEYLYHQHGVYSSYSLLYSQLDQYQVYYSLFPAWGTYMFIAHGLYSIFGVHTSILVAVNIILSVGTLWLLKFLLDEAEVRAGTRNLILALAACFPQMVMWSAVTSPDHFTIFFLMLLALLWVKRQSSNKKAWYVIAEAACVAVMGLFKPLTALMAMALVCTEILQSIVYKDIGLKKLLCRAAFIIGAVFVLSKITTYISEKALENYIKTEVQQATSFYLLWGYSVDEYGTWDSSMGDVIMEKAYEQAETMSDVIEYTDKAAKETIIKNIGLLPRIFLHKFATLFYVDNWAPYWSLTNENNIWSVLFKENTNLVAVLSIMNSFSLVLMPFSLLRKERLILFLSMGWMGYICFLLVAGVQSRYRFIMLPFQIALAVLGYMEIKGRWIHERGKI